MAAGIDGVTVSKIGTGNQCYNITTIIHYGVLVIYLRIARMEDFRYVCDKNVTSLGKYWHVS
jgi:hypothetical protein